MPRPSLNRRAFLASLCACLLAKPRQLLTLRKPMRFELRPGDRFTLPVLYDCSAFEDVNRCQATLFHPQRDLDAQYFSPVYKPMAFHKDAFTLVWPKL